MQGIRENLIIAERLANGRGYTWTLASRLGDMLHMAEELFGPRDNSYTILGIEFASDGPQIWYPGNRCHIVIQLDFSAGTSMSRACYQMAHEAVHLLSPSGGRNANNFEEGVACYFAAHYMKKEFAQSHWTPCLSSYQHALAIIKPRLDEDKHCVRRLREHQPSLRDITKDDIIKEFPDLTPDDVDFLVSKFDRDSGLGSSLGQ